MRSKFWLICKVSKTLPFHRSIVILWKECYTRNLDGSSKFEKLYLDSGPYSINGQVRPKANKLCKSRNKEGKNEFNLFFVCILIDGSWHFVHKRVINCDIYSRGYESCRKWQSYSSVKLGFFIFYRGVNKSKRIMIMIFIGFKAGRYNVDRIEEKVTCPIG